MILVFSPSSFFSCRFRPSIIATPPNMIPDCMLDSVFVPINDLGNKSSTAGNFARTVPMAAVAFTLFAVLSSFDAQPAGLLLAVVSGGITSGLGYVLWYRALRSLTTTQAAVLQLLVPVLAAAAGVAFLAEVVSLRLVTASAFILGASPWPF